MNQEKMPAECKKVSHAYFAKKELNPRTGKNVNRQLYVVFSGRISWLKQKQRTYYATSVDIYTMETSKLVLCPSLHNHSQLNHHLQCQVHHQYRYLFIEHLPLMLTVSFVSVLGLNLWLSHPPPDS